MKNENLTLENFWNELYSKYPSAVKTFCDWIDEYKKNNNWDILFNANVQPARYSSKDEIWIPDPVTQAPKFHDLPYALQLGIWLEFVVDRGGCSFEIEDFFLFNLREDITNYFKEMQFEYDVMDEFAEEEKAFYDNIHRINERILKAIKSVKGAEFLDDLKGCLKESEVNGPFKIVKFPSGSRQEENYGLIQEAWVVQHSQGDSGDSFYGTVTIKLKESKYLEMPFSI